MVKLILIKNWFWHRLTFRQSRGKQAEALRDSFDINKIDYVYASPLTRAKQTAEILNQNKHNIIYDDRLKEMILVIGTENLLQIFARNTHRPLMI